MSHDEQNATLGRILRERKEAQQHLQLLRSEARRIGAAMVKLGQQLQNEPEHVQFFGVQSDSRYRTTIDSFERTDFDAAMLTRLVTEIRDETTRVADLSRDLEGF